MMFSPFFPPFFFGVPTGADSGLGRLNLDIPGSFIFTNYFLFLHQIQGRPIGLSSSLRGVRVLWHPTALPAKDLCVHAKIETTRSLLPSPNTPNPRAAREFQLPTFNKLLKPHLFQQESSCRQVASGVLLI
eukprot:2891021-Pyramimonas_sp.AAC.1